jgi:hypothetical protein
MAAARRLARRRIAIVASKTDEKTLGRRGSWAIACLVFLYVGWDMAPIVVCRFFGQPTIATITRYVPRKTAEGHTQHYHELQYDGHRTVVRFGARRKIGAKRAVYYLPSRPSVVAMGSVGDSAYELLDRNCNLGILSVWLVIGVFFTFAGYRATSVESKTPDEEVAD